MSKVYFVGAGPGDPELITVKGRKIVEKVDVVIYAGSLVPIEVVNCRKDKAQIYNSASMTLDEVLKVIEKSVAEEKTVARIHTGDPSIYGAIREQIDPLEEWGIECEVIPGVSSFTASAAALKKEFTLPDVSQTVICTRVAGRTSVPEDEDLDKLASHKASMAIFLSVGMINEVVKKLKKHYPGSTPAAVVQRASWPEQEILIGTLDDIAQKVEKEKITKTAQILVGNFLGNEYKKSKLYDEKFTHEYRKSKR